MRRLGAAGVGATKPPGLTLRPKRRWSALLGGFLVQIAAQGQAPDQVTTVGLPPLPAALKAEVAPYLDYRIATFQDWHPDRRDILMTTRAGETAQLHEVTLPAAAPRQLTFLSEPVRRAAFEPEAGKCILLSQDAGGGEAYQLYRFDPETGSTVLLTDGASRNTSPCWARNGKRLAYLSTRRNGLDTDLYLVDAARPRSDRMLAPLRGGGWQVLDWAPGEDQLLLLNTVSVHQSSLHVVTLRSGASRPVTHSDGGKISYAGGEFTPDGEAVITTTDQDSEYRRLVRLDLRTGACLDLYRPAAGEVEAFDLSPNGRQVALLVNREGISELHVIEVESRRERRVPRLPVGVASGLRWHSNNREIAFTLSSAQSPGEVLSVHTRLNALTGWTRSKVPGLNTADFKKPELVRVTAFDKVPLSGFLYRPDPKPFPGPRPVLAILHGGPESQARPVFQGQWNFLLEQEGIALLYPNVRGSSGFGKTFLGLDNGFRREDAVRDVSAFLDWLAADARLDDGRVALYGASYGGYLVLASLIHHGHRVRCGIDVVGISSFPTFLQNTPAYRRDLRRAEYGDERDAAMARFLSRISPLNNTDRLVTPLLVAHGRNDARVPVGEAEQLIAAMRSEGREVWSVIAGNEGHGFARKANSDFLFCTVVQFLREHLLARGGRRSDSMPADHAARGLAARRALVLSSVP
jgi:dipeptidyl aminopeptidase/acylaminoacyl peptidase